MSATATDAPAVRFAAACKSFGDTRVLDRFDLDIPRGEKTVIIGPSGSGKSTLLRILMTLEGIESGRVEICGETLTDRFDGVERAPRGRGRLRKIRGHVGMVFQQFNLFPHMSALENVACGPRLSLRRSRVEAEAEAEALLRRVGLGDKLGSYPLQLSGGQQQRVAIARAMALRPEVMLFDEVTSALDPELIGEVLAVMRELASETSLTMLVVTHQMGVARALADRVCFLENGRLVEQGPPEQVLDAPENPRTREFLHALNLA
ncbi:amino acid ABC transporter ATP-binding protein [Acuticoccus mangrovi]|uniref:Amino acid ABC transporter ATP-binding protein n=1 Tax=Acuticoccus mangrovi TaxID=2796142 RepID=A0A934IR75_9HYPH|nr:amino acid ABC transporter ATP-binding protein [Acuticoccus mangrovi]